MLLITTTAQVSPDTWILSEFLCDPEQICNVGDLNGDGLDDIVIFTRENDGFESGAGYVALSTGDQFAPIEIWEETICPASYRCQIVDVNGDGLDDIVIFATNDESDSGNSGLIKVALSTGQGFSTSRIWLDSFCFEDDTCMVADINGDGLADFINFVHATGTVRLALSTDNGFEEVELDSDWFCTDPDVCLLADANGDGLSDLIRIIQDADSEDNGHVMLALSSGTAFNAPRIWITDFCLIAVVTCIPGDFDGDNATDILQIPASGESEEIQGAISTGRTFEVISISMQITCSPDEICIPGDFNGDQITDILIIMPDGNVQVTTGTVPDETSASDAPETDDDTCTPAQPSGWVAYRVQSGDTLSRLANGTSIEAVQDANCLNGTIIIIGTILYLAQQPPALPTNTPIPSPVPQTIVSSGNPAPGNPVSNPAPDNSGANTSTSSDPPPNNPPPPPDPTCVPGSFGCTTGQVPDD